ncbi:ABC transporter ATP-binding protein [Planktothrix sp. FACHB-1365]|uniref:ABC transporter ATP-binding protein n=1 Tax=Planktothrix sp. FACHB-1365 TaxID=2692855 RepID=UPI001682A353|nr:ABC transporter ATP-binding protein [Planktothrix sp. FACHB-1365]MBD2485470.1 ABC transporter ATP-binding protein [Planktothrix sp. FACHB-1365]
MIKTHSIHVTFNQKTALEKQALRDINLTIPEGQFITVIGSNGAGKSTLLNVLTGDILPNAGKVWINDQEVTTWSTSKRAKFVARVFQNPLAGSCANLTVEENLALAYRRGCFRGFRSALNHRLREEFRCRLARLNLGLENRLGDRMGLLSGGQRQAVSLLMSTLASHQVLLLDEHTAALDPKTANYILQLTREIVAENRLTTLMVTHSMRQALDLGDRTLMLHEGQIIFDISGSERQGLTVTDLLHLFEEQQQESLTDDALLLG